MGFLSLTVLHSHIFEFTQPADKTLTDRDRNPSSVCTVSFVPVRREDATVSDHVIRSVAPVFSEDLSRNTDQMESSGP